MKDFKLLSGLSNNQREESDDEEYVGASWIFCREEHIDPYVYYVVVEYHNGIRSFLHQFPYHHVVSILSITGPNGIVHSADNENTGWGFDITSDLIRVEWLRFRN
jgi:hypothetical protein